MKGNTMKLKMSTALAASLFLIGCQNAPQYETEEKKMDVSAIPGSSDDFKKNVPDRALFAFDSSSLNHKAQHNLVQQCEWLKKYPHTAVVLEGHTDKRGTREYNLALGERRAVAAKAFLAKNGVGDEMGKPGSKSHRYVRTVSYGKDKLPGGQGDDEMTHQMNRVAISAVE